MFNNRQNLEARFRAWLPENTGKSWSRVAFFALFAQFLASCAPQAAQQPVVEATPTPLTSPAEARPAATLENLPQFAATAESNKESQFPTNIKYARVLEPTSAEAIQAGADKIWETFQKTTESKGVTYSQMILLEGSFDGQEEVGRAGVIILWGDQAGNAYVTGANRADKVTPGYMGLGNEPIDYMMHQDATDPTVITVDTLVGPQPFFRVDSSGTIQAMKPFGQNWIYMGGGFELAEEGKSLMKSVAYIPETNEPAAGATVTVDPETGTVTIDSTAEPPTPTAEVVDGSTFKTFNLSDGTTWSVPEIKMDEAIKNSEGFLGASRDSANRAIEFIISQPNVRFNESLQSNEDTPSVGRAEYFHDLQYGDGTTDIKYINGRFIKLSDGRSIHVMVYKHPEGALWTYPVINANGVKDYYPIFVEGAADLQYDYIDEDGFVFNVSP